MALINQEDLIDTLDGMVYTARDGSDVPRQVRMIVDAIRNAPVVDAVPVVHGAWIPRDDGYFKNCISQCSACGKRYYVYPNSYNYCPNCGARMDLEI